MSAKDDIILTAPSLEHPVHWIASDADLAEACARWRELPMLAVDTEFMRSTTYYPEPALVQVNDGAGNYLIDPLAIDDFEPLSEILTNPKIAKVLHSCSEDLEVFQTLLGTVPDNIFDTQVAAALCGYGFSLGFANLVHKVLDVDLPKDETRSNWLQRPLSQPQVLYAAVDVEYLLLIAHQLHSKLAGSGRLEWLQDDAALLTNAMRSGQDPEVFYLRIKSAWRLNRQELAILQRLAAWRERTAQQRNVPRNRVVKEHVLVSIAKDKPRHVGELRKYEGMIERVIRADGDTIIAVVEESLASDQSQWPVLLPKPLPAKLSSLMKQFKKRVNTLAEELDMAPELLMRKKDYEHLVREIASSGENANLVLPENLRGWREEVLRQPLVDVIENYWTTAAPENTENTAVNSPLEEVSQRNSVLCDVYRSGQHADMYLYIDREVGLDVVPEELKERFGKPVLALTLTLTPERELARANIKQVLEALRSNGFYLQMPPRPDQYMQGINDHNAKLGR